MIPPKGHTSNNMIAVIITLGFVFAVGLILALIVASQYNGLVVLRNAVKTAFAQIDVQLQRRHDLIPNLVEVAKRYMSHEKDTLEGVIQARSAAVTAAKQAALEPTSPHAVQHLVSAEQALGGALSRLFALREAYPDLKADGQMTHLMAELSETEDRVAVSRQSYNNAVMQYNNKTELFPSSIIAGIFKFYPADLYQVSNDEAKNVPSVEF